MRNCASGNLEIPGSMRSLFIGPRFARTRWHRPGMMGHDSAISRREAPEVLQKPFAQEIRGRRECRVPAAPIASRAK
jgi:hypothetical protein